VLLSTKGVGYHIDLSGTGDRMPAWQWTADVCMRKHGPRQQTDPITRRWRTGGNRSTVSLSSHHFQWHIER